MSGYRRARTAGAARRAWATTAGYLVWHAALLGAAVLAVARVPARRATVAAFTATGLALIAYASIANAPFGDLATPFGSYHPGVRTVAAALALGLLAASAAWWREADRSPPGPRCA